MSFWKITLLVLVVSLAAFALGVTLFLRTLSRNPTPRFAQEVIAAVSAGDWEKLTSRLGPSYGRFDPQTVVEEMANLLPPGPPKVVVIEKTVDLRDSDGVRATWITLNCRYPDHDPVRVRLLLKGYWDDLRLDGFEILPEEPQEGTASGPIVDPTPVQVEEQPAAGWRLSHVVFAILAPAMLLFTFRECILALRQPDWGRRIGDALISLIAVGAFELYWPTGAWRFSPFTIQLGPASFSGPTFSGPWLLSFAIPVGAIYVRNRRLKRLEAEALKAACAALPPSDNAFSGPGAGNENTGGLAPAGDSKS